MPTTSIQLPLSLDQLSWLLKALDGSPRTELSSAEGDVLSRLRHAHNKLRAVQVELDRLSPATQREITRRYREDGKILAVKWVYYNVVDKRSLALAKDLTDAVLQETIGTS